MRVRIRFEKKQEMRYTGHLDLQRAWERTIRRAQLPLAYSQGFNPRPKLILAAALPLGFTSECELVEFWLTEEIPLPRVEKSLSETVPPGIQITDVESVELTDPKLPNLVEKTTYEVALLAPIPKVTDRISSILKVEKVIRERRGKKYDLRPLILSIEEIESSSQGTQCIQMDLLAKPGETGRPDEVLNVLEIPINLARIHRKEIVLRKHNRLSEGKT